MPLMYYKIINCNSATYAAVNCASVMQTAAFTVQANGTLYRYDFFIAWKKDIHEQIHWFYCQF